MGYPVVLDGRYSLFGTGDQKIIQMIFFQHRPAGFFYRPIFIRYRIADTVRQLLQIRSDGIG